MIPGSLINTMMGGGDEQGFPQYVATAVDGWGDTSAARVLPAHQPGDLIVVFVGGTANNSGVLSLHSSSSSWTASSRYYTNTTNPMILTVAFKVASSSSEVLRFSGRSNSAWRSQAFTFRASPGHEINMAEVGYQIKSDAAVSAATLPEVFAPAGPQKYKYVLLVSSNSGDPANPAYPEWFTPSDYAAGTRVGRIRVGFKDSKEDSEGPISLSFSTNSRYVVRQYALWETPL